MISINKSSSLPLSKYRSNFSFCPCIGHFTLHEHGQETRRRDLSCNTLGSHVGSASWLLDGSTRIVPRSAGSMEPDRTVTHARVTSTQYGEKLRSHAHSTRLRTSQHERGRASPSAALALIRRVVRLGCLYRTLLELVVVTSHRQDGCKE